MNKNTPFKGIIAYPITPFTREGKVDLPLFCGLLEKLVQDGANGIAPSALSVSVTVVGN
jgi:4-hydroxy-tetrahydrodipicolinate synthase